MDCLKCFLRKILDIFCLFIGWLMYAERKNQLPPIRDPVLLYKAAEITEKVRTGQLKVTEVIKSYRQRISEVNKYINAVVQIREEALSDAANLDQRIEEELNGKTLEPGEKSVLKLPLLGVPFTCKETVGVQGMKCTLGVYARRECRAPEHAMVVRRLMEAGAIPIGTTNVPEQAIWWDSENKVYGRTNNPYDLSRIPGGSSGGEGAIIAAAGSLLGLGTDIGGSIRLPGFFCGIFGHKPTPGVVPTEGIIPYVARQREMYYSVGPMCRYASDLLPVLKVIISEAHHKTLKLFEKVDLSKISVFYMDDDYDPVKTRVDPEIKEGMKHVINYLENTCKVKCQRFHFERMRDSLNIWVSVMKTINTTSTTDEMGAERLNLPMECLKCLFGYSEHTTCILFLALVEKFMSSQPQLISQEIQKMKELKQQFSYLLGNNGVFLYPTHPEVAPKHGTTLFKTSNIGFVTIFNVINTPVTQCPLGRTSSDLPFGIQIVSNENNDHLTIAVAEELEKAFGGWVPPTPTDIPEAQSE